MLSIRVVSRAGEAPATPMAATFGPAGGDIGRGADCTLVLPDPDRRISRKHALVSFRDGRAWLRQLGIGVAVELDGRMLGADGELPLPDGAQIRIGPYVLVAEEIDTVELPIGPPLAAGARPEAHAGGQPATAPAPLSSPSAPPAFVADVDVVLDDCGPMPAQAPAGANLPPPNPAHPAAQPPPAQSSATPFSPAQAAAAQFGPAHAAPAPSAMAQPSQALAAPAHEALQALYEGLGVAMPPAPSPEQARRVGALLRATVAGTLELLAARNIAKRELGANPTLLQVRENNPLKFSPDVDAALGHLLGPAQRGFVAPLDAVNDAFQDLRAHELALLAGMRAALDAVLARFDPALLEQRLAAKTMWASVMPAARKARLWEAYAEQHAQMLHDIEEDFDTLFGRAFVQAYHAQLEAISQANDMNLGAGA